MGFCSTFLTILATVLFLALMREEMLESKKQLCAWGSEYNQKYWTSYWASRSVAPTYEPYEPLAFYDAMCIRTCRGVL